MNEFLLLWLGFNCMFNRNETSPLKMRFIHLFVNLSNKKITWNEYSKNLTYPDHQYNCIRGLIIWYWKILGQKNLNQTIFCSNGIPAFITWTEIKIWSVVRWRFKIEQRSTLDAMQITAELARIKFKFDPSSKLNDVGAMHP